MQRRLTPAVLVALAMLWGCSSGSDDDGTGSADASASDSATDTSATDTPDTAPNDTSDTSEGATSDPTPTAGADVFVDPDGLYTITIDEDWDELPVMQGIEAWSVAATADGFTPNVNILNEDTPGVDLDQYVELSIGTIEQFGTLELVEERRVTGSNGEELAVLEYVGVAPGADQELHFLAVIAVDSGSATVATLTTQPADFDTIRSRVEPFMLTLQTT